MDKMRKIYRIMISIISIIGAMVMWRQQDYFAMVVLFGLAGIFLVNVNKEKG